MMGLEFQVSQVNLQAFPFSNTLKPKNRTINIALADLVDTSHQVTKTKAKILTILMDKTTSLIPTT